MIDKPVSTRDLPRKAEILKFVIEAITSIKSNAVEQPTDSNTRLYELKTDQHAELTNLGLDSLDTLDLLVQLAEQFNVELPVEMNMGDIMTVGDVVDAIVSAPTSPERT